ncbi:ABC transporter substrate-binding protein [Microvirga lotononidis]|uniref:ABC-type dipeptide transport system, periplasmic component n=1 Tax=Microvirga lotononidis TaxID=864069 RepID=I4YQU3_9HYPH|nr:ABC transporter substrate-binding protein [Microvirga lotononidis]EIM26335.1 ABC-type dipeptide transport system, periplasmic component [Microvirga lotononidis]WQO30705.1 ABC transporter substrate-binding protein [Microvirga lotononidis]
MKLKSNLLLASCVSALMAASVLPALAQQSVLRIALNADIRSTNPGVNRDDNTDAVVLHAVEGLVGYGENASIQPLLAESFTVSEDGRAYVFKLRNGVKFHNGADLTSQDVAWNWKRYTDPKTEWRCLAEFDGRGRSQVEAIETPDPQTVVFRLTKPDALFLATLARTDCGMTGIIHKDSVKADGSWDKPIGTGPFKLTEWRRGEFVKLTKFDGYANRGEGKPDGYAGSKRPLVDEVRFIVIPDSAAAKAALLRGDVDVVPDVANADVKEIKGNANLGLSIAQNMGLSTLLMQTRDPLLSNVKMRQAIAAALDTPQIAQAVTEGLAQHNNSVVPLSSSFHTAAHDKGYTYDPEKAKKLLQEAGYKGEPLVILTNKRYPQTFASSVIAQAMLQAVGINANLEVLEWGTQLDRYSKGNYQMMAFPYSARLDPSLSYESVMGPKDKQPRKVWDSPEAQALLEKSMVTTAPEERQKIFDELQSRFLTEVPFVMLYNGVEASAFRKNVQGYTASVLSKPRAWEVRIAN